MIQVVSDAVGVDTENKMNGVVRHKIPSLADCHDFETEKC